MSDWSDLEDFAKQILHYDDPKRTPASGATKGEEDVIGRNTITQCKFTKDKNISILKKDLDRLLKAAELLNKFPIFLSESDSGKVLSLPIVDSSKDTIESLLKLAAVFKGLVNLHFLVEYLNNVKQVEGADIELRRLRSQFYDIQSKINTLVNKINTKLDAKRDDLIMYNLFEEDNNNGT